MVVVDGQGVPLGDYLHSCIPGGGQARRENAAAIPREAATLVRDARDRNLSA